MNTISTADTPVSGDTEHLISRSPSPAAPPPVQNTPGPRAVALQKLYKDAITHVLKTCNYTNFASCFPTPSAEVPDSLKHLHEQFTDRLGASMRMNFEQILAERNVVASLNELDSLVEDAKKRKAKAVEEARGGLVEPPAPPHTLPAQQLYLSHLAPSLSNQSQALRQRQEILQSENAETLQRVLQQRRDIEALMKGFENVVQDLDDSVATLKPGEIDQLRTEAREVDEEMRMTT